MLTIPDFALATVNGHPQQAAPDTTDIAALVSGVAGVNGVVSGFDASYHGTMTVSIAAGSAKVNGATVNFAGADVTIGSNTAGYQRTDIVCLKSDGTLDLIQGVPGNPPIPPGLPASECYLYRVDISNGVSQIMSSDVTDKRAPAASGAGGGGAPTGAAGGALSGTYPNPSIASGAITSAMISDGTIVDADISGTAGIAQGKVSGLGTSLSGKQDRSEKGAVSGYASLDTGAQVPLSQLGNAPGVTGTASGDLTGSYPGPTIASGAVTSAKIADGTIVDADISGTAAIAQSKVNGLAASIAAVTTGITVLGNSNGTDDTTWINAILAAAAPGSYIRGTPGQTYLVSAPLVLRQGGQTTLDMTGCTIKFATTAVRTNLLNNASVAPSNTATDLATTAGSNVVTSPALVAAGAAVGHSVGVVAAGPLGGGTGGPPRIWLYGKITAIAGNNITLGGNFNPTQADVSLTAATGYLFKTRDGNVTVIGGTWDAGTNWNVNADRYSAAYNSNLLRFRRCDGLTVRDVKLSIDIGYATSGSGWCFGINPADCTAVLIENPRNVPGQAAPTFVNSSGLVSGCVVRNVEGTSYDDMVAFGCVGAGGDDIEGDIGDLLIDGVFSRVGGPAAWNKGSNRGVDLYTGRGGNGQQRVLWTFDVRAVKGTYNNWPVSLVSYPPVAGQAANFSGRLGDISGFASGKPSIFIGRADGTNAGLNTGADCAGTVTGPNTGGDLAEAQITTNAAFGPTTSDVAGLSITFTAPPSGVVWLEAFAYTLQQGSGSGNLLMYIADNSNNVVHQCFLGTVAPSGFTTSPTIKVRVSGLVSGTSYTYKIRASSSGTGAGSMLAGTTYPAWIRATAA